MLYQWLHYSITVHIIKGSGKPDFLIFKFVSQPSEFMMEFSFCGHGASINENYDGKILPTLFFMLAKIINVKENLNHNDKINTHLYCIKCYSSYFFFSFLEQNCSAFSIEILIIVIRNSGLFSFLFLFFFYVTTH